MGTTLLLGSWLAFAYLTTSPVKCKKGLTAGGLVMLGTGFPPESSLGQGCLVILEGSLEQSTVKV